jgi:hypothetical protein
MSENTVNNALRRLGPCLLLAALGTAGSVIAADSP